MGSWSEGVAIWLRDLVIARLLVHLALIEKRRLQVRGLLVALRSVRALPRDERGPSASQRFQSAPGEEHPVALEMVADGRQVRHLDRTRALVSEAGCSGPGEAAAHWRKGSGARLVVTSSRWTKGVGLAGVDPRN